MNIPKLKTERMLLRQPEYQDWERYCLFMGSDKSRHMGGPYSVSASWGWYCSDIAQWMLFGHGALMLEHSISGECLGQICINHGPLFPEKELGWYVYPDAEGKGYAFEAALMYRAWAIESNILESLVSYISPDNIRSCKLAERLGAVIDDSAERPDPSDLVYRHPLRG